MEILSDSSSRVLASQSWFLFRIEPDSIYCLRPASGLEQKIEFVFSRQSRNISTGELGAAFLRPIALWQDLAGGASSIT